MMFPWTMFTTYPLKYLTMNKTKNPNIAEMRFFSEITAEGEGEDKSHHLRQQWRPSMSSDQHFSLPRFCFTLLITGSLTTDKNYSSKTCGECARRALYGVRYYPDPPSAPPCPLARIAITLLSRVRLSLRLTAGPWQHYYSLVSVRPPTKERASRRVASVPAAAALLCYTRGGSPPIVSVKRLKNVCFSDDPESDVIVWIELQKGMRSGIHF